MSPEEPIQNYLEELKKHSKKQIYINHRVALTRFLEYLRLQNRDSLNVESGFIDQYRKHLFLERAQHRKTAWQYIAIVKTFYEHLKNKNEIKENPVRPYQFKRTPLKNRSYTDEEILRAYIANWRKLYTSPSRIARILRGWKKVQGIMVQHGLRLQGLEKSDLEKISSELDHIASRAGTQLCPENRQDTLSILKGILQWMYRNGYLEKDLSVGLGHPWTIEEPSQERLNPFDPIAPMWKEYENRFLQDLQVRLRPNTLRRYHDSLKGFWIYLSEIKIKDIHQITKELLENYRARVYAQETIADATRCQRLHVIRYFMNWLERTDQILANPANRIQWPKRTRGLPTRLMSTHDVAILMSAPDIKTPFGLRARAMFEVMYSTGIRAGEASGIRIEDIDFEYGLLKVREPKGGLDYQRVIPIGIIALEWVRKYMIEARDYFNPQSGHERHLFLSQEGKAVTSKIISSAMRYQCMKQGMRKIYSSHSWRVTCATSMLRNRADIRHVQEQLGHRSLDSTQIYTRLCPVDLKKVHQKTHPREREHQRLDPRN